jgi:hypothetical protein
MMMELAEFLLAFFKQNRITMRCAVSTVPTITLEADNAVQRE